MPAELHDPPALTRAEHAVARSLAETDRPDDVYPRVLQAIGEALGWLLGSVWEASEGGDEMRCAATWQAPGVQAAEFRDATEATCLARGMGLPGRVWESGEPAWL